MDYVGGYTQCMRLGGRCGLCRWVYTMYEVGGEEGVDYVGGYTQCMRLGERKVWTM